jgi:hypothetical protein
MPSRKAVRADDKRLAKPGQKDQFDGKGPRSQVERYLAGELKVADMDDEELRRGKWRNEKGTFKGVGGSKMMPRKFFEELRAETMRRWNAQLVDELEPMRDVLKQIALNPKAPADARHKSAIYLIERVVGKVPEKSEMKVEVAKWEENIEGILTDVGADDDKG